MTSATSPLKDDLLQQQSAAVEQENQRISSSANQLDVIVDILGVPSELLSQRDFNKRLFLLKDRGLKNNQGTFCHRVFKCF